MGNNESEKSASLARVVRTTIEREPYVKNPLADGLINYSALARELSPRIEQSLGRKVKEESIIVAIKRYADEIKGKSDNKNCLDILSKSVLSMQEDVSFALLKSDSTVLNELQALINESDWHPGEVRIIVEGPENVIVLLKTPKMEHLLKKVGEDVTETSDGNVLITLHTPEGSRRTYGIIAEVTSELSKKGISVELIAASTYLHFLVSEEDSEEAYKSIKNLVKGTKQLPQSKHS